MKTTLIVCSILALLLIILTVCICLVLGIGAWFVTKQVNITVEATYSSFGDIQETLQALQTPWVESTIEPLLSPTLSPSRTPVSPTPTQSPTAESTAEISPTSTPAETGDVGSLTTLNTLENMVVPVNDPIKLVERLEGRTNLPVSLTDPPVQYQVGAQQSFWVSNSDTDENRQAQAVLRYKTEHVYFWIENGVPYNNGDLKRLVDTFENKIYPKNREFFGSEWTPGVDNDVHLYILYAKDLGQSVAGYYSPADELLPAVREDSNGHEMFLISAEQDLADEYAYTVLAHEFQHMIHWYRDRNEETWLNEGFSNLAAFLNGYNVGYSDFIYANNPDMQLTSWPPNIEDAAPNYGAAFLFVTYFLDRFGEEATKAVVADKANSMVSIDQVLAQMGIKDPSNGNLIQADDVFADWVVASFLQKSNVADGRYTYHNYPEAPRPTETETIYDCPHDQSPRDVSQYGVDYIRITCVGDYNLRFESLPQVGVLPTDFHSGLYGFYSNRGDDSDITLTRTFDFTGQSGPLTLTYWTWYDLEEDYDYVYLLASEDGENWQFVMTPSGTGRDPTGNSFGWGYTGQSGSGLKWVQEEVDLSQFAGKKIQLRFEYITDAAVNMDGFLLDDIAIPEIGYSSDFENDDGGWQADGFVRIQNVLPQTFKISLILIGNTTTVQRIDLTADNIVNIPLHLGTEADEVILVVSGTTRFTTQKALYYITIE